MSSNQSYRSDARRALRERWYEDGWFSTQTLAEVMAEGARRWPALEVAFETTEGRRILSLGDALANAERVAAGLHRLGVRSDDVVAVQLPNWPEALVTYAAVARLGATILP